MGSIGPLLILLSIAHMVQYVLLKSIDTSGIIKNSEKLFELFDDLVKEIGKENVVQVVTDSASAYVGAGKLLEEKRKNLFWSPCVAHCIA